ncbi:MAG: hypothetical protein IPL72_04865 [Sulfuritalea sp.]|nr:hypothetical protein [Sulfuritalea sp.]
MKYRIEKQGDEVVISFEQVGGEAQEVIAAISRCRQGARDCATGECTKIGDMSTQGQGVELAVRLKPRADMALDVASLGECLKYQLPKQMDH